MPRLGWTASHPYLESAHRCEWKIRCAIGCDAAVRGTNESRGIIRFNIIAARAGEALNSAWLYVPLWTERMASRTVCQDLDSEIRVCLGVVSCFFANYGSTHECKMKGDRDDEG